MTQLTAEQVSVFHHGGNKPLLHQLETQRPQLTRLQLKIFGHLSHPHRSILLFQPGG
ncbi:hypothetical protein L2728_10440 [Shewanella chilikensis]|nr:MULTISPECIES: hypothetical protein [Shewanella]MCL1154291.1 hypothetical protein [Shewanella chilikensis]MCL1162291.1 hypothetical protein [Shewanella chilikensis]